MPNPPQLPTQFAPTERAPLEVLREQHDLIASLPLLRPFLDATPDIFLVLNEQRQIVFANRPLLDLLGLDDDAAISGERPGEALDCVHASETAGGCGTTAFCRTCGAVHAILASLDHRHSVQECRISTRGGEALDLRVYAQPLVLEGQTYSLFVVQDIRHEKRRRALEHIFFHDLLNTAGGIIGFADLLHEELANGAASALNGTSERLQTLTHHIRWMGRRLADEITAQQQLLAAERGELVVEWQPVETLALLRNEQTTYQQHPIARERQIVLHPQTENHLLTSDAALLRRVLGNMVKNALEALKPGETVTLHSYREGDEVVFTVHNPGHMPPAAQLQVFQRSFSTKGSGRGLGTYSIRLLSERYLGGRVSFHSTPEDGTTFTARYPLVTPGD